MSRSHDPVPARPGYTIVAPPLSAHPERPPWAVRSAFWTWLASFVAGLAAIAYSVSRFSELRTLLSSQVIAQQPQIGSTALDRVVDLTLYVGLAGTTSLIVVQLMLAVLMRARRNWARLLLAAIGLLGLLWTAFSLITVAETARMVLLGQAALLVAATVLMFLPGAGAWFRTRAR